MTMAQFTKKIEVARRIGSALLPDGGVLYYRGNEEFAAYDGNGNCVEVSKNGAKALAYLFV